MERKQELMLIIRQLKKDLCGSASYLNIEYKLLNKDNIQLFKDDYKTHEEIHFNLSSALHEYNSIK